jgi:23S rRNA (guanosine2251-2'-O)-methyltransferase
MDIVAGRKPVLAALSGNRRVRQILLTKTLLSQPFGQEVLKAAAQLKIPVNQVTKDKLDQQSQGVKHQGILAQVDPFVYLSINEAELRLKTQAKATVVLLDGLTDPQNLGAIARTCLAFNVSYIFLPKRRTALITPTVVKAAAGATEHLQFVQGNLAQAVAALKAIGFWLYAAAPEAELSLKEIKFAAKSGLIFGAEGKGLSSLLRKKADYLFKIPLSPKINSLNVAAAAAICLWERFN